MFDMKKLLTLYPNSESELKGGGSVIVVEENGYYNVYLDEAYRKPVFKLKRTHDRVIYLEVYQKVVSDGEEFIEEAKIEPFFSVKEFLDKIKEEAAEFYYYDDESLDISRGALRFVFENSLYIIDELKTLPSSDKFTEIYEITISDKLNSNEEFLKIVPLLFYSFFVPVEENTW